MDIECLASDWREGRSVSNSTARSVQQVVEDVSPGVTYTFPPMKHLKMQGRFFNTTTRLVHEISHEIYVCGLFHRSNDPVGSKQPSSQIIMPHLIALPFNSPIPTATDANLA